MEPVKQQVIMGAAERIVIQVPQFPPGTRAEVTVVEQFLSRQLAANEEQLCREKFRA